jgi:hypothetical protein
VIKAAQFDLGEASVLLEQEVEDIELAGGYRSRGRRTSDWSSRGLSAVRNNWSRHRSGGVAPGAASMTDCLTHDCLHVNNISDERSRFGRLTACPRSPVCDCQPGPDSKLAGPDVYPLNNRRP